MIPRDAVARWFHCAPYLRLGAKAGVFECDGLLAVAVYGMAQLLTVIGVDRDPVASAADRNVKLLSIDEFNGAQCVDVRDYTIDGRTLARMRG